MPFLSAYLDLFMNAETLKICLFLIVETLNHPWGRTHINIYTESFDKWYEVKTM